MQGENSVRTGRVSVQIVLSDRPLHFTLKEAVQGFLLSVADLLSEALNGDSTALVIRDLQVLVACNGTCRLVRQQVSNLLIVDLRVTDPDSDRLIKLVAGKGVDLGYRARHQATVLKYSRATRHRVSLAGTRLSVAEDSAIVALDNGLNDLTRADLVGFILARIMKNLLEVELPDVCLIVNHTKCLVLVLLESDCTCVCINLNIFAGKIGCWSRSYHDFDGLLS